MLASVFRRLKPRETRCEVQIEPDYYKEFISNTFISNTEDLSRKSAQLGKQGLYKLNAEQRHSGGITNAISAFEKASILPSGL